jgi:hypothetical protein
MTSYDSSVGAEQSAHHSLLTASEGLTSIARLLDEYEATKDRRTFKLVMENMKSVGMQVRDLGQNPLCKTRSNQPLLTQLTGMMVDLVRRTKTIQTSDSQAQLNAAAMATVSTATDSPTEPNTMSENASKFMTPTKSTSSLPSLSVPRSNSMSPISMLASEQQPQAPQSTERTQPIAVQSQSQQQQQQQQQPFLSSSFTPPKPLNKRSLSAAEIPQHEIPRQAQLQFQQQLQQSSQIAETTTADSTVSDTEGNSLIKHKGRQQVVAATPGGVASNLLRTESMPTSLSMKSFGNVSAAAAESAPHSAPTLPKHTTSLSDTEDQLRSVRVSSPPPSPMRSVQGQVPPQSPSQQQTRTQSPSPPSPPPALVEENRLLREQVEELQRRLAVKDANNEAYYGLLADLKKQEAAMTNMQKQSIEDRQNAKVFEGKWKRGTERSVIVNFFVFLSPLHCRANGIHEKGTKNEGGRHSYEGSQHSQADQEVETDAQNVAFE